MGLAHSKMGVHLKKFQLLPLISMADPSGILFVAPIYYSGGNYWLFLMRMGRSSERSPKQRLIEHFQFSHSVV